MRDADDVCTRGPCGRPGAQLCPIAGYVILQEARPEKNILVFCIAAHIAQSVSSSAEADDTTARAVLIHVILLKMYQTVSSSRHSDDISERWQQEVNQLIFEILFETKWKQCLW